MSDANIALDKQYENWNGRNLNQVRNIITVIPYFEMKSQIILLLITIASLGKSQKCQLLIQQGAPEVDIDIFSGDPLEYHYFREIFNEVVENRIEDPRGLIKYTTGKAKDLIKHCIQQPLSEWYKNALELLIIRYGDPLKVLAIQERN